MLAKARVTNALNKEISSGIETLLESNKIESKIFKNEVISKEDITSVIEELKSRSDYWVKKMDDAVDFIESIGGINVLVAAANDTYSMKDMRKDLSQITKILKTSRL